MQASSQTESSQDDPDDGSAQFLAKLEQDVEWLSSLEGRQDGAAATQ